MGVDDSTRRPTVGVFFGEPGETVPDPYFGGEGPDAHGLHRCGACMVGCRHGAKNTLVKNYLWFAEKPACEIRPSARSTDVRPLGAADGRDGYEVTSVRRATGSRKQGDDTAAASSSRPARSAPTGCSAVQGPGSLPRLSDRLGELVRTNSEALLAVTAPEGGRLPRGRRDQLEHLPGRRHPHRERHLRHRRRRDGLLFTLLTEGGTRLTRPLRWAGHIVRHPRPRAPRCWKRGWSKRTVILLVMQTLDNSMRLKPRRSAGRQAVLQTEQDRDNPNPTWIPAANRRRSGSPRRSTASPGNLAEAILNTPATAHILGGCVIADGPRTASSTASSASFGYENLIVCDGSVVPANPGVNPSLTITALAEHAMAAVPPKATSDAAEPLRVGRLTKRRPAYRLRAPWRASPLAGPSTMMRGDGSADRVR